MSTEVLKETLMGFKNDLVDYVNDENFDILDEVSSEEFATQVIKIAQRITFFQASRPQMAVHGVIGNIDKGVIWNVKVNNVHKGWVSVSDDNSTGLSETQYYPFFKDEEDGYFAGLCSLASMINEAWWLCNSVVYDGYSIV